uniref:Uncharacterized protein n=1 Tax=Anguilla anguilla TaxID=7936 RepID=A0A0E9TV91_ANGAN
MMDIFGVLMVVLVDFCAVKYNVRF